MGTGVIPKIRVFQDRVIVDINNEIASITGRQAMLLSCRLTRAVQELAHNAGSFNVAKLARMAAKNKAHKRAIREKQKTARFPAYNREAILAKYPRPHDLEERARERERVASLQLSDLEKRPSAMARAGGIFFLNEQHTTRVPKRKPRRRLEKHEVELRNEHARRARKQ